jgi:hypothetical protein
MLKVTTCAGRFEATYQVDLAGQMGNHVVKVETRTGLRTIKPQSKIWKSVIRRAIALDISTGA